MLARAQDGGAVADIYDAVTARRAASMRGYAAYVEIQNRSDAAMMLLR